MEVGLLEPGDHVDPQPSPAGPGNWSMVTCVQQPCLMPGHRPGCVAVGLDRTGGAHKHDELRCAASGLHRQAEAMLLTRRPAGGSR
jgi:hypothetical protein